MQRQPFVDVLRGFALIGILMVNIGHFSSAYFGSGTANPMMDTSFEQCIAFLVSVFFDSKFYLLFSFLFGYSFYLQSQAYSSQPHSYKWAYFRRLSALLLLGIVHALLLTRGDILIIYAIAGVLLWSMRDWSRKSAIQMAICLIILPNLFLTVLVNFSLQLMGGDIVDELLYETLWLESELQGGWREIFAVHHYELMQSGFSILVLFGSVALAMMILGERAGRAQLFLNFSLYQSYFNRVISIAVLLALPAACFYSYNVNFPLNMNDMFIGILATTYTGLFLTALYVIVLWRLWQKRPDRPWLKALAAMGRMSLSNYIVQSIICTYLFFGVGFGWIGQLKPSQVLLVACLILIVQCCLSQLWLRYFHYGPLEWLLRCITHLRLFSLKKRGFD